MQSSVSVSKSKVVVFFLILLAANPWSATAAFNARLQGQSRGSTAWIGGNLQGWRDLDEVPCRVYLTGGPANNKTITVEFDRMQGRNPGIENLSGFTASPNVVIASGPVLSAPPNSSRWTHTFTVKLLDKKPGCVKFNAKLACGAHQNGGSSVGMRGSPSLGNLQIHKPAPRAGEVDLALVKSGPSEAAPGQTITYTLQYSNKPSATITATGVQVSDIVPPEVTVLTETLGAGQLLGNTIVWNVGNLAPGAAGTLSYGVRVNDNVPFGQVFTNSAFISSAHAECKDDDDSNRDDNHSSVITRVVFNRAPVANPDSYQGRENEPLIIPAPGVLANDSDPDNDPLTAILVTGPAHGLVTLNANGSFQYVPASNFTGSDSFTYKANDGLMDSLPAMVTITVEGVTMTNRPPIVSLIHPTNGAIYIEGMDIPLVAEASDPDGTIMQVDLFTHDTYVGSSAVPPYTVLLTNVAAGDYLFRAVATDNSGASAVSDPVAVTVLEHPPFVAGPFRLNRQTGLFEQTVTVSNPTPLTFEGIRLWIMDVRSGATVWNATGQSEGVPFIEMLQAIPSGASIDIRIEYYTPDVRIAPQPTFLPEVL